MKDVQNGRPNRKYPIDKVGIKDIQYPVTIVSKPKRKGTKRKKWTNTVALASLYVYLPKEFKGTHMSRFVEVLHQTSTIDPRKLKFMLRKIMMRLNAKASYILLKFPYFMKKSAPVSGEESILDYQCTFAGYLSRRKLEVNLTVEVPVTSCCPCSKEISERGAHNQRCNVTVTVRVDKQMIWIEDLIKIIEGAGSCEVFPLLKRQDEKFVTEKAFDNPMFVEDLARETAYRLKREGIKKYTIEVESFESIHNHSAYAIIDNK